MPFYGFAHVIHVSRLGYRHGTNTGKEREGASGVYMIETQRKQHMVRAEY